MNGRSSQDKQARQPKGWWQQYLAWSGKAKKTPAQPKPRVRLTLLVLLWVWASLMFVVIDLFYNVSDFDGIRPRSHTYRAMRETAHEMVGRALDDSSPPSAAQFHAEDLPRPPPEFRGTVLQWRVKRGDFDGEEMSEVLKDVKALKGSEQVAVLRRVRQKPDVAMAPALIQAADRLPADPVVHAYYSGACLSVLRAMIRTSAQDPRPGDRWEPRQRVLDSKEGRELLERGLAAEAYRVVEHGQHLDHNAWAGVLFSLEGFERAFPDLRSRENCVRILAEIEGPLLAELGEALEPRPGYRGGVGAIRLAAWLGSPAAFDLLVRLFANHDSLARKLPDPEQENELAALDEILRAVAGRGSAPQRSELARLIAEELDRQEDARIRERMWRYARVLAGSPGMDVGSIRTLTSAQARGEVETSIRDSIRQAGAELDKLPKGHEGG